MENKQWAMGKGVILSKYR